MLQCSIEHGHRIWFVLWAFYSLPGGNRIFPDQAPRRFGANCKLSTSLTQFVYRKHRLCCASLKKMQKEQRMAHENKANLNYATKVNFPSILLGIQLGTLPKRKYISEMWFTSMQKVVHQESEFAFLFQVEMSRMKIPWKKMSSGITFRIKPIPPTCQKGCLKIPYWKVALFYVE